MSTLKARDVEEEIRRQWAEAQGRNASYVDIRAGDTHRTLGGKNRAPQVCQVMMRLRNPGDSVIEGPPSGQSTSLTVRYLQPREANSVDETPILEESPLVDEEPQEDSQRLRANHDAYGKLIMRNAAGGAFSDSGAACTIRFGDDAARAKIDGVVGNSIAVEIESRTPKQIRGAVLDLIFHPYPRKLLLIIAGHQNNARQAANQCRHILREVLGDENFQVVLLGGMAESRSKQETWHSCRRRWADWDGARDDPCSGLYFFAGIPAALVKRLIFCHLRWSENPRSVGRLVYIPCS